MSRRGGRLLVSISAVGLVAIGWLLLRRPSATLATPRLAQFLQPVRAVDTAALIAPLRVAVAVLPSRRAKDANWTALSTLTRRAKREHPDLALLVFGEASFGLYHDDLAPRTYQAALAEPIPGPLTEALGALAHELGLAIAVGLIERTDSALHNTLVVVDSTGRIVATHRKMMLHWLDEANGITVASPRADTLTLGGLHFGLSICADQNSPWLVAAYRAHQIDALIYPVTSAVPGVSTWLKSWPYARVYDAWILAANRSGTEGQDVYPGTIFIAAPNGHMQAHATMGEGYVTTRIGRIGSRRVDATAQRR